MALSGVPFGYLRRVTIEALNVEDLPLRVTPQMIFSYQNEIGRVEACVISGQSAAAGPNLPDWMLVRFGRVPPSFKTSKECGRL